MPYLVKNATGNEERRFFVWKQGMAKNIKWWTRKLHRWGAIITLVPLGLVIVTGLLLQVKKEFAWIQPPTQKGTPGDPGVAWDAILTAARSDPSAAVQSWGDIDRLDVQPGKGIVKVQCKNRWELQLDLQTAEILSSKYRRSDFIESLHDGSFFHELAKLYVFLPNGLILLGLWLTGAYLWWMPFGARRRKQRRTADVA